MRSQRSLKSLLISRIWREKAERVRGQFAKCIFQTSTRIFKKTVGNIAFQSCSMETYGSVSVSILA